MERTISLITLPTEIQLAIINCFPERAIIGRWYERGHCHLLNLSLTCSHFRKLSLPSLFRTLVLRNEDRSAECVAAIARSDLAQHVKRLLYVGRVLGGDSRHRRFPEHPDEVDREIAAEAAYILPEVVQSALASLERFPNLQNLTVVFDSTLYDFDDHESSLEEFGFVELLSDVIKAESEEPRRWLMAKAWSMITQNRRAHIKALEVRDLIPREVSTFREPAFHRFLNGIERFTLSTYGEACDTDLWELNTMDAAKDFHLKLDIFFFDHLLNVKHLSLSSGEGTPLGTIDLAPYCIDMPLKTHHMPHIESVHLERVFMCAELSQFLVGHSGTLRSVALRDCMASQSQTAYFGEHGESTASCFSWARLFRAIREASPKRLTSFVVDWSDMIPAHLRKGLRDRLHVLMDSSYFHGQEGEALYNLMRTSPEHKLFQYRSSSETHGPTVEGYGISRRAFVEGNDQREYDRLMDVVRSNR